MKRNDIKALAEAKTGELQTQLNDFYMKLAQARHEKKVGRLSNPRAVGMLSDDIARIKTVLKERELIEAAKEAVTA